MRRGERGFTLLEVTLAVLIVATALLTLQGTVADSVMRVDGAIKKRAARTLARLKLEEILANPSSAGGDGTFEEHPAFTWSSTTSDIEVAENHKIIQVTVTVSYELDDPGGASTGDAKGKTTLTAFIPAEKKPN